MNKTQRNLNLLRHNLHGCSERTKEMDCKTLDRPTLKYASIAWDPYKAGHIKIMEAVQSKAAKFVTGNHSRFASVSKLKTDLGWRLLQERRLEARLCLWYKAVQYMD